MSTDARASARLQLLENVLARVPYHYQNKPRLRQDVGNLLRSCSTLEPRVDSFSGSGRTVTLFFLSGVLPITYSGATYNIPVTIYFDPPYPSQPPRCFVTPTKDMAIKPEHQNVDTGGLVYVPYLSNWTTSSTLQELVAILSSLFAASPPVYQVNSSRPPPQAATRPPISAAGAQQQTQQPQQQGGLRGFVGSLLGGTSASGYPQSQAPMAAAMPVSKAQPVSQPSQLAPAKAVTVTPTVVQGRLVPMSAKEQLVGDVTEQVKERWPQVLKPLVEQANQQLTRGEELQAVSVELNDDLESLRAEAARLEKEAAELEETEGELQQFVDAHAGKESDPDSLRDELDADSAQVLDGLAEELAMEDLLVALDELLAARKISLDDFVREVRDVSRRQFMIRVRRKKCAGIVAASVEAIEAGASPTAAVTAARAAPAAPVAPARARVAVAA